jgi:hypothetical protein
MRTSQRNLHHQLLRSELLILDPNDGARAAPEFRHQLDRARSCRRASGHLRLNCSSVRLAIAR